MPGGNRSPGSGWHQRDQVRVRAACESDRLRACRRTQAEECFRLAKESAIDGLPSCWRIWVVNCTSERTSLKMGRIARDSEAAPATPASLCTRSRRFTSGTRR
jgi:hypothetical protein